MNNKNLIPNSERTPSERKENAKKGGKKSGEARREKKKLREMLEILMIKEENGKTTREEICVALIKAAINGNVKAFEIIRDTIGEKPVEKVESKSSYKPVTPETARQIAKDVFGIE